MGYELNLRGWSCLDSRYDLKGDIDKLMKEIMEHLNNKHNCMEDKEKLIDSILMIGLARLEENEIEGHELLQKLYLDNEEYLKSNNRLFLKVKRALARSKKRLENMIKP